MNYFVEDPRWGWEIIAYFYLGGLAAGSYFLAVLIEWFGSPEDESLADIAYYIAFPLIAVCGLLLTIDLQQPLRFWHMLFQPNGTPILKYWSPMSIGSWGLTVFGACSFISFVAVLLKNRWPGRVMRMRWPHLALQIVGCIAGFFIASYTGGLLSATNQPMWSDTVWLAPLFLASAASTSLALMSLIAHYWQIGTPAARERLEGSEPLALGLELIILGAFVYSLGDNLVPVLMTVRGSLLIFGTLLLAILIPLLTHLHFGRRYAWCVPAAAWCVLLGGLVLRYGAITTPGELLRRGPEGANIFAPEEGRERGQPGADVGHHVAE
jgi:formate-dependent nitrite reductase membrane component NrfD